MNITIGPHDFDKLFFAFTTQAFIFIGLVPSVYTVIGIIHYTDRLSKNVYCTSRSAKICYVSYM